MAKPMRSKTLLVTALLSASAVIGSSAAYAANTVDKALNEGVERVANAQKSQQKIDSIDSTTREAEREYRAIAKEIEGLNVYVSQLDRQLNAQQRELGNIEESIEQVTLVERQITPLMLRMIDAIDQFVAADVPFLKEERSKRVAKLKDLMGRSDVTVAEKYRKVMEAYPRWFP